MKKLLLRSFCLCLMMVLAVAFCATPTYAKSKSIKMNTYEDCIVDGSNVYCLVGNAIWKVNMDSGSVTKVTSVGPSNSMLSDLKLKSGYLYFVYDDFYNEDNPDKLRIYRVKKSGESKKKLVTVNNENHDLIYAIKGKKIYYTWTTGTDYEPMKTHKRKMNLNGSKKVKTKTKVKYRAKKSNKSGYSVNYLTSDYEGYTQYSYFLYTPNGNYYITDEYMYY